MSAIAVRARSALDTLVAAGPPGAIRLDRRPGRTTRPAGIFDLVDRAFGER